jgi:hypothetical protein
MEPLFSTLYYVIGMIFSHWDEFRFSTTACVNERQRDEDVEFGFVAS